MSYGLLIALALLAAPGLPRALVSAQPAPPKWPSSYTLKYTWSLPEVLKVQTNPLSYPVTVAYDGPNNRIKVDVWNGLGVTIIEGMRNTVAYARQDKLVCESYINPNGPRTTHLVGTPGTAKNGVVDAPLPDLSTWVYNGTTDYQNKTADVWLNQYVKQDKTNTYRMLFDIATGTPLQLHILGYNIMGASHYDEYVADITSFTPGVDAATAFQSSSEVRRSRRARALIMLPWSRMASTSELHTAHMETARAAAALEHAQLVSSWDAKATGFSLRLNRFSDMLPEEFEAVMLGRRMGGKRTAPVMESARNMFVSTASANELPASLDYRNSGYDNYGMVKDQADCGSCWSFAATGAMEAAYFNATGRPITLSQQYLMDCSWDFGNAACDGGLVEQTMDFVSRSGMPLEADYQYLGVNAYCGKNATNPAVPKAAWFKGSQSIPSRNDAALMEALWRHGPLAVSICASGKLFKFYGQGVYDDPTCGNTLWELDHAVTLMGYGTSPEGKDYWIIKNSWSRLWGDNGYAYVMRGARDCGISTNPTRAIVDPSVVASASAMATKTASKAAPKHRRAHKRRLL